MSDYYFTAELLNRNNIINYMYINSLIAFCFPFNHIISVCLLLSISGYLENYTTQVMWINVELVRCLPDGALDNPVTTRPIILLYDV